MVFNGQILKIIRIRSAVESIELFISSLFKLNNNIGMTINFLNELGDKFSAK